MRRTRWREALDRVFARLGPSRVIRSSLTLGGSDGATVSTVSQPGVSTETAALLEELLPYYDRLADQSGEDPMLAERSADAIHRIADIRRRLGQYEQARTQYVRAVEMYRSLLARAGGDGAARISLAEVLNDLGQTCLLQRKMDDAVSAHRQAMALLTSTNADTTAEARFELARTYYFLGSRARPETGTAIRVGRGPGNLPSGMPANHRPASMPASSPSAQFPLFPDDPPRLPPRDGLHVHPDGPIPDPGHDQPPPDGPSDRRDGPPDQDDRPPDDGPPPDHQGPPREGHSFDGPPQDDHSDPPLHERPHGGPPEGDNGPLRHPPPFGEFLPPSQPTPEGKATRQVRQHYLQQAVEILTALTRAKTENPEYRYLTALCYREMADSPGPARDEAIGKSISILESAGAGMPTGG